MDAMVRALASTPASPDVAGGRLSMCGGSSPSLCCHEECHEEIDKGTGPPLKDESNPMVAMVTDKGNDVGRDFSGSQTASFDPENSPVLHVAARSAAGPVGVVSVR